MDLFQISVIFYMIYDSHFPGISKKSIENFWRYCMYCNEGVKIHGTRNGNLSPNTVEAVVCDPLSATTCYYGPFFYEWIMC